MSTAHFTPLKKGFTALALVIALASCSKEAVEPVSAPVSGNRQVAETFLNTPQADPEVQNNGPEGIDRQPLTDVLKARKGVTDPGSGGETVGDAQLQPGAEIHPKTLPVSVEELPYQGRRLKDFRRSRL